MTKYHRIVPRCKYCYLPMRFDMVCLWFYCHRCPSARTLQEIEARSRWRQRLDRLTGMV